MSKRSNYYPEAMEAAIQEMQSDGTSLRAVAKKYGFHDQVYSLR
jgi:transposase-like protein